MKSKTRKIIVNGEEYRWMVGNFNCDGDYSSQVKIWKNKELLYDKLNIDDELTNVDAITPKIIEQLIMAL